MPKKPIQPPIDAASPVDAHRKAIEAERLAREAACLQELDALMRKHRCELVPHVHLDGKRGLTANVVVQAGD